MIAAANQNLHERCGTAILNMERPTTMDRRTFVTATTAAALSTATGAQPSQTSTARLPPDEVGSQRLLNVAHEARRDAYSKYSGFQVGAALLAHDGTVITGCNVENASFGLTVCAERIAIFNAIAAGETNLRRLLAVADTAGPVYPCGACRQVMSEFSQDMEILSANGAGGYVSYRLDQLLPHTFKLRD